MKAIFTFYLIAVGFSASYAQEDAMTITSNGNVGINTTNPAEKLDINGNAEIRGNVSALKVNAKNGVTTDELRASTITVTNGIGANSLNVFKLQTNTATATKVFADEIKTTTINATGMIQQNGYDLLPKGAIIMWYGSDTAPAGWAICDGTQNTPDLRGRFIVGVGKTNEPGATNHKFKSTGGEEKVTLTENQMPSHKHSLNFDGKTGSDTKGDNEGKQGWAQNGFRGVFATDRNSGSGSSAVSESGKNEPHENRPPYYALYYIIKI